MLLTASRSGHRTIFYCRILVFLAGFVLAFLLVETRSYGGNLSDPQVDAYNLRIGTETFAALYKFTPQTALVETAQAITNLGSDTIKLYLGANTAGQAGVSLTSNITNLLTLARDEPSYRQVFDMPFRHIVFWAYPFANSDEWWGSGYNQSQGAKDYREIYDLTHYLLTNYNNSGKTFYLGHWEGDGYLSVNGWSTNPSMTTIQGMIGWLNNRQQAVDDAKRDTPYTNVTVFNYAECNRVRDAMLNNTNNNERVINYVIPYVTNLDVLSYSSYDAQNLSSANLYATLDYMESKLSTNKAASVPGPRMWIGEYGWGTQSTAAQEPLIRAYIQRLLNWSYNGQCLPFILYWEMYSNYNPGSGTNYCLIDYQDHKVPAWYLHNYFYNTARMLVAQFKETNGRLPTDTEFTSMVSPMLNQPLTAPVELTVSNGSVFMATNSAANVSATLAQGIYGDSEAGLWVYYGTQDGGTTSGAWQHGRFVGINTNFNPATFTVQLSNLTPQTNYFYRFYAANTATSVWSQASSQFSTVSANAGDYGARMKVFFSGYTGTETLSNFPVLVSFSNGMAGFSYRQFASASGGDLRFTDATGWRFIPHEIDEWNTNGISLVWINVPVLNATNNFIWAYWGNPAATVPPAYTTNGAAWPAADLVWHLKESGFPYADSTLQHPATAGTAPVLTAGEFGHGESFNGSSQYLNAGPINLGSAFTLSAWVKLDPAAANIQTIWANKTGGWNSAGFSLYANSYNTTDGRLILETGDGVNGVNASTGAGVMTAGVWHYVTASVNEAAGTAQLYVDGTNFTSASAIDPAFPNQSVVNLGRFTNGTYYCKGVVDEARIQPGALSANAVWASWAAVASSGALQSYSAITQQAPLLTLSGAAAMQMSWPASGVGFALYFATNLTPPMAWTLATNQPFFTNNQWQIVLPATNDSRFYRLQSQ